MLSAAAPFIANSIVDSYVLLDPTLGRLAHLKGGTPTSLVRHLLIRDGLLYYIVIVIGLVSSLPLGFYRSSDLLSQHLRLWLGGYSSTCNKLTASCLSTAPWLAKDQVIDIEFVERLAPAI